MHQLFESILTVKYAKLFYGQTGKVLNLLLLLLLLFENLFVIFHNSTYVFAESSIVSNPVAFKSPFTI